jgi:hypothetical protein
MKDRMKGRTPKAPAVPKHLRRIVEALRAGDYSVLRGEKHVFEYAAELGMQPADLIRAWQGTAPSSEPLASGRKPERVEPLEPDEDLEHLEDDDQCLCPCTGCYYGEGDCSGCLYSKETCPGGENCNGHDDEDEEEEAEDELDLDEDDDQDSPDERRRDDEEDEEDEDY